MYLRAAKTDAESAGESTDGMASSISELRGELLKLTGNKVDIQLDNNTFKSTYQILKELSEVWKQLDDTSHANILEMVGGKRNANVVAAILENFSVAEDAMATAADSAGSALEENEKFLDSIQGKLNILKATFEDFSQSLLDSEFLKGALDVITGLVKGIDFLVDKLGALATIGGISGAIWGVKNFKNIKSGFDSIMASGVSKKLSNVIYGKYMFGGNAGRLTPTSVNALKDAVTGLSSSQATLALTTRGLTDAQIEQVLSAKASTSANMGLSTSFKVLSKTMATWLVTTPVGAITLLAGIMAATIGIIDLCTTSVEEHREKLANLKSEYADIKSELDGLNGNLKETQSKISELESKGKLSFVENEELNRLRKTSNELQRNIDLLELKEKRKNKEVNKEFVETMNSDIEQEVYTRDEFGNVTFYMPMSGQSSTDDNEIDYINQRFEDLSKLKDALTSAETQNEKDRIQRQITDIENYLQQKNDDFADAAENIDYIRNPTTEDDEKVNEWLDYIHDFQDKMAIALGGTNAKSNAFNRIVDNWKFDALLNPLQTLGKQGKVTAEMLKDPRYAAFIQNLIDIGFISDKTEGSLRFVAHAFNGTATSVGAYLDSFEDSESISDFIKNLDNEAKALGTTRDELTQLTASHIILNNTKLSLDDKINLIKQLGIMAGWTRGKISEVVELMNRASGNISTKTGYNGLVPTDGDRSGSAQLALHNMFGGWKPINTENTPEPPDPPKEDPKSAPDKPEFKTFTPEKYDYDKEYYDNYDEALEDNQKAREGHDDVISALEKDLDDAVESGDISRAQEISGRIKEANDNHVALLKKQKNDEEYQLNNELLPAIYEIAPELQGKTRDEMSDAEIENVRRRLEDNIQAEENKLVDEKNRINKEINDIENAWEQESYDLKIANGNKETEAYKAREAEVNSQIDALKAELDGLSEEGVKTAEFTLDKFDSLTDTSANYAEDIKDIGKDIEESVENTEDNAKKVKDSINNAFDEYQRHIDRTTKALEEQAEAYDILINKGQALIDAERKMYDAQASVREIQRDIAKELRTNKAMAEYLDEETRKRLFNEDDYNTLDKKLTGISEDIGEINAWYNAEISKLTEDNWYLESAITAEYERRLESKQKEYEIARAELDLEKKKLELNNILNERNIRMLTKNDDGSYEWKYVHNTEEASRVVGEIADLEGQIAETRLQAEQDAALATKQAKVDQLNAEQAAINNQIDQINKHTEALSQAIEDITNPLQDFGSIVTQLNAVLSAEISTFGSGVILGTSGVATIGSSSSKSGRMSDAEEWNSLYGRDATISIMKERSALWSSSDKETQKRLHEMNLESAKLIGAEYNDRDGHYYIDGKKLYDHGGIAEGKGIMVKDTNLDELVLDPQQTDYFKNFVKNMDGFDVTADIMSKMIKNMPSSAMMQKYSPSETYEFNGDIVLPNVTRPEDFMKELKRSLQQNSFKK